MKKLLLFIFLVSCAHTLDAACTSGQFELIIKITPDSRPQDISWKLSNALGATIAQGTIAGDTICLNSNTAYIFTITDAFNDGIDVPGGFWLYVNGTQIVNNPHFTFMSQHVINGVAGTFCINALPIMPGNYTADYDDTWYQFTPNQSGLYTVSTCGLNSCDTKIWLYNTCPVIPYLENMQGTYSFNDDNCGVLAEVTAFLMVGTTYYIRIGDNLDQCTGSVNFSFAFDGPITGCTDINACNYNPQAAVDDGSCIYAPNPGCAGPDLQIDSMVLMQNLQLMNTNAMTCDVVEGCVTGYGVRRVLAFTSRIHNIGTLDFYIGNETTQPGMFNTTNCHGHDHYEGYGDYRLYDSNGNLVPAGHKNGYCVIDLCSSIHHYTCTNMGISAGCYDAYGVGTQCQWVDITDVPDGDYRLAVIINSKHLPDALGRFETNYLNNATQVCLHIFHDSSGIQQYTINPNCSPFVDCMGIPAGVSEMDCNGVCNGPGIYGDTYQNSLLDNQDVYTYLDLMQANLPASVCNDLNADNQITVYDAALVNWCLRNNNVSQGGSNHNHCNFPRSIYNPNDLVSLSIANVNLVDNYIDIAIQNPVANVKAYQFSMRGIVISSVVSLANPVNFPIDVRYRATNEVFGISIQDSSLIRSITAQPLVRIYFSSITDTLICISHITEIINHNAEQTNTNIFGNCFAAVPTSIETPAKNIVELLFVPNPVTNRAFIHIASAQANVNELQITDVSGKVFIVPAEKVHDSWYDLNLSDLPPGVYFARIMNSKAFGITRFVKL